MLKLVMREILTPYGYSKVRNTSLRFLWLRTGPHTVYLKLIVGKVVVIQIRVAATSDVMF